MLVAHRRSELCPFSAAFPRYLRKALGSSSRAAGLVCTRRVFYSAPGKKTLFTPSFRLPVAAEGAGEFHNGTEPSPTQPHKPGQPRDEGDGSSLAVVANIHGCSCQSPFSPVAPLPGLAAGLRQDR